MALLTAYTIVKDGVDTSAAYASCAGGGDEFPNDGRTFVHIKNGSGGALVATLATAGTYVGHAIADTAVSIGAGGEEMIGPFPKGIYNASDGNIDITYDGVTSLTIGVFKLP